MGEKVGLFDVNLNVFGIYGSGNIRIGGDFLGLVIVFNVICIYVDEKIKIFVIFFLGEGGNIVIFSVEEIIFFGKIEVISYVIEEFWLVELNFRKNIVEVFS